MFWVSEPGVFMGYWRDRREPGVTQGRWEGWLSLQSGDYDSKRVGHLSSCSISLFTNYIIEDMAWFFATYTLSWIYSSYSTILLGSVSFFYSWSWSFTLTSWYYESCSGDLSVFDNLNSLLSKFALYSSDLLSIESGSK